MQTMITLAPSPSYQLDLPDDIQESYEDGVTNLWQRGSGLALQLSSKVRNTGQQTPAQQRLDERMQLVEGKWKPFELKLRYLHGGEVAAAQVREEEGLHWAHVYVTWPDLTVYATISGPPKELGASDNWAQQALASLRRTSTA